jgi:hypothetical protein
MYDCQIDFDRLFEVEIIRDRLAQFQENTTYAGAILRGLHVLLDRIREATIDPNGPVLLNQQMTHCRFYGMCEHVCGYPRSSFEGEGASPSNWQTSYLWCEQSLRRCNAWFEKPYEPNETPSTNQCGILLLNFEIDVIAAHNHVPMPRTRYAMISTLREKFKEAPARRTKYFCCRLPTANCRHERIGAARENARKRLHSCGPISHRERSALRGSRSRTTQQ